MPLSFIIENSSRGRERAVLFQDKNRKEREGEMEGSNGSKVIIDCQEDFEFVQDLLQHNLGGGKIDQKLIEQLKTILQNNVVIDHATAIEQNQIQQIKMEGEGREREIGDKIIQVSNELMEYCKQNNNSNLKQSIQPIDTSSFSIEPLLSNESVELGKGESLDQLNDLIRLCRQ